MRSRLRRVVLTAAVAGLAVAASSVAFGAIPDSGGLIHGCYSANGSKQTNGAQLNLVDPEFAACNKNQKEATWNQQGPPGDDGNDGADGVSVTSTALSSGDPNCPSGGSKFTAANDNVTYACNGLQGETGETGAAGPSAASTNYGDGFHTIADGTTQTVASVTVPAGKYIISGAVQATGVDDLQFLQCAFEAPGATVNGRLAVLVNDGAEPLVADVTLATGNSIRLRCNAQAVRSTGRAR